MSIGNTFGNRDDIHTTKVYWILSSNLSGYERSNGEYLPNALSKPTYDVKSIKTTLHNATLNKKIITTLNHEKTNVLGTKYMICHKLRDKKFGCCCP